MIIKRNAEQILIECKSIQEIIPYGETTYVIFDKPSNICIFYFGTAFSHQH